MTCPKASYTSEARAKAASRLIPGNTGERMRCFLCDVCHRWHLATGEPRSDVPPAVRESYAKTYRSKAPRATTREDLEALALAMRGGG